METFLAQLERGDPALLQGEIFELLHSLSGGYSQDKVFPSSTIILLLFRFSHFQGDVSRLQTDEAATRG